MTSINEAWESIKDYTKEKTNPFLITIIVVWLLHHWEIVYAFFTFDSGLRLDSRIEYLKTHWSSSNFLIDLLKVIGLSFLVLIATQILIYASRVIINLFSDIIAPIVAGVFKKGKVIEKKKYDEVVERNYELEKQIIEERNLRIEAQRLKEESERTLANSVNQAKSDTQNEVYNAMRILSEIGKENANDFFKHFSDQTDYSVTWITETLRRRGIVVPTSESDVTNTQRFILTYQGYRIKEILEKYQSYIS